jgi:hypothetical protein
MILIAMPSTRTLPLRAAILWVLAVGSVSAFAGRPLVVDDANVNEAGHGQLEAWALHTRGARVYSLAPAYAPIEGLEIGALLARDRSAPQTLGALQAKWRITPSQESGCNVGAVLGVSHTRNAAITGYLNGLLTCNQPQWGSMHVNLGLSKTRGAAHTRAWGVAFEREVMGVTPHVEWFGAQGTRPTVQVGLRGNITKTVQLDGSIGRADGRGVFTLGTKLQF